MEETTRTSGCKPTKIANIETPMSSVGKGVKQPKLYADENINWLNHFRKLCGCLLNLWWSSYTPTCTANRKVHICSLKAVYKNNHRSTFPNTWKLEKGPNSLTLDLNSGVTVIQWNTAQLCGQKNYCYRWQFSGTQEIEWKKPRQKKAQSKAMFSKRKTQEVWIRIVNGCIWWQKCEWIELAWESFP